MRIGLGNGHRLSDPLGNNRVSPYDHGRPAAGGIPDDHVDDIGRAGLKRGRSLRQLLRSAGNSPVLDRWEQPIRIGWGVIHYPGQAGLWLILEEDDLIDAAASGPGHDRGDTLGRGYLQRRGTYPV
jgi:hypothetical protein